MQFIEDPSPPEAQGPGGTEPALNERSGAAGPAPHVGEHQFEYPTVAPAARPTPAP
jgi:hypothetical protein